MNWSDKPFLCLIHWVSISLYFTSSNLHMEFHTRIVNCGFNIRQSDSYMSRNILSWQTLKASANKYWIFCILCMKLLLSKSLHNSPECWMYVVCGLWRCGLVGRRGWRCGHCVSIEFDDFNIFAALYRWNVATRDVFTVCLNYNLYLSTRQKILSFSGP